MKTTYTHGQQDGKETLEFKPYDNHYVNLPGYEGYALSRNFSYHWTPRDMSKFE